MEKNLFQKLPKVDILMKNEKLEEISKKLSYHNYYQAVKDGIEFFRNKIKNNEIENFSEDEIILKIKEISGIKNKLNLRRVINGTGTIIHTNLGRSILNEKITEENEKLSTAKEVENTEKSSEAIKEKYKYAKGNIRIFKDTKITPKAEDNIKIGTRVEVLEVKKVEKVKEKTVKNQMERQKFKKLLL